MALTDGSEQPVRARAGMLAVKEVVIEPEGGGRGKARAALIALEHEGSLLYRLAHPNIVRCIGTRRDETAMSLVLEFVPGGRWV
jgi:hypothetical protein